MSVERLAGHADPAHHVGPAADGRHERHLVVLPHQRLGVGVLAVDRHHARPRRDLHRVQQVGDARALGQLELHPVRSRALAQAGEQTDGDSHTDTLDSAGMEGPALSHLDAAGQARMVDVGGKEPTTRWARARAVVRMSPGAASRVASGDNPKGDVIAVARIAAIQAAKRTDELIPLCHQLPLSHVDPQIAVDPSEGRVTIVVETRTTDRTGVEMEAMVACSVGALTIYDMVKGIEPGVVVERVELLDKTGGKADFHRS